jgi:hypothetical protein
MAKHCEVCNKEYPENLSACPHCAAARVPRVPPGSESEINLDAHLVSGEHPSEASEQSSVVNLGERGKATHHAIQTGSESEFEIKSPPAPRVPDTNSGVAIHRAEEPSDSSVEEWAALVQDAGAIDQSGVRVDSPSDKDLLAKATEADSSSDIGLGHSEATGGDSGLRIVQHSEADVVLTGDSGSRIYPEHPAMPTKESSGVRIVTHSEPDVLLGGTGSEPDVLPSGLSEAESSAINLGELPPKNAPADLALASDALESGTSGIAHKSDATRGDSVEALVELPPDSGISNAPLAENSGSGPGSEQSGLDLTMLSGGSSGGSSILPERPRRAQPPAERSGRRAPPTHHSIHEHFTEDDDSAVQLGALPKSQSDEEEAAASSHAKADEQERLERKASPARPTEEGSSGRIGPQRSRSVPMVLAGTALGLILGAGGTAAVMSMFGGGDSKPMTSATAPNAGQLAAAEQAAKEWTTQFPDKRPDEIANTVAQLDAGKQEAEKNLAAQTDAVKAEQTKSANLSNDLKAAVSKATELTEKANAAEKKAADLAAAEEKAKTAEAAASKRANTLMTALKDYKTKLTELETAGRDAADQMAKLKDELKAADAKNTAAAKQVETATAARKESEAVLQAAVQKLKDGKYLKGDATTTDVARAVEQVISAAKLADPSGKLATIQAELASTQSKLAHSESALKQRWTPQAMLDVWLVVLQQPTAVPAMAKLALADVDRVTADAKAGPTIAAKAACVKGLALRHQGRKEEAKSVLAEAVKNAPAEAEWLAAARTALEDKPSPAVTPSAADSQESNPLLAEAAYMAGVQSYWAGRYDRAEQQFLNAIRNDGRDARYHYYLGLTRLSLKKRTAAQQDFERGAGLERQGRPSRVAVNAALERIQGGTRETVEGYRR